MLLQGSTLRPSDLQQNEIKMPNTMPINTAALTELVGKFAYSDGDYQTAIPGLMVYRRSSSTAPMPSIYALGLALTVQGVKVVTLGNEVLHYGTGQSLVTSLDVPVVSHITNATVDKPYLGLCLALDVKTIAQVAAEIDSPIAEHNPTALSVMTLEAGLLDAVIRLVSLLDEPVYIPQIAPLIQREIAVRLLGGQHGPSLRHLVTLGSQCQRIAKAISWLRQNFTGNLSMDDLADRAHMSPSSFRQHFRSVAGMSPLQYIKHLRLQEAKHMMMNGNLDAGSAALRVGYESASQFSREYTRLFGQPPGRDVKRARVN